MLLSRRLHTLFIRSMVVLAALHVTTTAGAQEWQQHFDRGAAADEKGQKDSALYYYMQARAAMPKDSAASNWYANLAYNIAYLYHYWPKYAEAEPYYVEGREIWSRLLSEAHPSYMAITNSLAVLYQDMGQYEKAEPLFIQARKTRAAAGGKENTGYADACNNLAINYYYMGQYDAAETLYLETKELRGKLLGTEHADYASACNGLAIVYKVMGKYKLAEPLFLEAKAIRAKIDDKGTAYAGSCINLASLYKDVGNYPKAIALYLEAKVIIENTLGKMHPYYATCCNNLANTYMAAGRYEEAEPLVLMATTIREQVLGKDHPDYSANCNSLASLYEELGDYQKAERWYLEAKAVREKVFGKDHSLYADACNNLAIYYFHTGQNSKAEALYLEARGVIQKVFGKRHLDFANNSNNLGAYYKSIGQYSKAEPFYKEAVALLEELVGKEHSDYASAVSGLGVLYYNMEDLGQAEPLYVAAKDIREKVLGKDHPDYASSCNNLAVLYHTLGALQKAEPLFIESKAIREKVFGKKHSKSIQSSENLAELWWARGKTMQADELYVEVFNNQYERIQKLLQFTSEKEKEAFINNVIGNNDKYYSFYYSTALHHKGATPFTISASSRNLILSSTQQLKKVGSTLSDKKVAAQYEQWNRLRKTLAAYYVKESLTEYVEQLEDSANKLEKSLALASASFKYDQAKKGWKEIQNSLRPREAAIEFIDFNYYNGKRWTDSIYYAAVLLKKDGKEPVLIPLFEKKRLDSILLQTGNKSTTGNVQALYASRGAGEDEVVVNKSLYDLVWKPIEKHLGGTGTIYFAPSGLLHRVAFGALPVNGKELLSDKYRLVQLSNTLSITSGKELFVLPSDKIVLYGGIDYDTDAQPSNSKRPDSTASVILHLPQDRGSTWTGLPGTKKEVEGIKALAKERNHIQVVTGDAATEEVIKRGDGISSPAVLHIATHGFFFPDPQKKETPDNSKTVFEQNDDPLLRAGLLFAGANTTWKGGKTTGTDDGIFTAYEVSNMYLPNTKLVVLSACETGLGDIQGAEGVYGLQRAFKMAGAENLIMSLWKVPDAETAEFMQELYKHLFAKKSIRESFFAAQQTMKNKYRNDPYLWAAWIMVD